MILFAILKDSISELIDDFASDFFWNLFVLFIFLATLMFWVAPVFLIEPKYWIDSNVGYTIAGIIAAFISYHFYRADNEIISGIIVAGLSTGYLMLFGFTIWFEHVRPWLIPS